MRYRILFFLALCLSVRRFQMPFEVLSVVKTLRWQPLELLTQRFTC